MTAPEGSVLNPIRPRRVAARALTGYRVMDTMFGALAQIVPHVVPRPARAGIPSSASAGGIRTTAPSSSSI